METVYHDFTGRQGIHTFRFDTGRFIFDVSNFSAGFGDVISLQTTAWLRNSMGSTGGIDKCSRLYTAGEYSGYTHQVASSGLASLRIAASVSLAQRGNIIGKTLSQGRYIRVGGSGGANTPMIRVGPWKSSWNHIDLTVFGR